MIRLLLAGLLSTALTTVPVPTDQCATEESKLKELSGLVVLDDGLWGMPDTEKQGEVYRLDPTTCEVVETRKFALTLQDTEDLARGPDGALWIGDIGDNDAVRPTITVVEFPAAGGPAQAYQLTYPDGARNAEALLIDADRRPIIVTKDPTRPAGIYRTAAAPQGPGPTPMVKVGEVTLPPTSTPPSGPDGPDGSRLVDGAAATFDGRVVALRSYTDAWLFPVPNGDIVAALAGRPVQVPLPGEPQGEAITFDQAGTLYSGSETLGKDDRQGQLRVVPSAAQFALGGGAPVTQPGATAGPGESSWSPAVLGAVVLAIVLLPTMLLVVLLIARRIRRR